MDGKISVRTPVFEPQGSVGTRNPTHYESCVVGDVRYNTLARDEGRKTQNSAIMSTDTYDKETTEMYANITDISSVCGSVVLSLV